MGKLKLFAIAVIALTSVRCALYSDVVISPFKLLPSEIYRGSTLTDMVDKGDYLRAVALGRSMDPKTITVKDLASLGEAEVAMGRLDDARRHLRRAFSLEPPRPLAASIAWDLSQLEYLANNHDASLEWAREADNRGLYIRQWHMDFLEALATTKVYRISGNRSAGLPMEWRNPTIPRIRIGLNGVETTSIIDSGATLSIISVSQASRVSLKTLGNFKGTFFGLLDEPIAVTFGLVEKITVGKMEIRNVPVAVMADDQMNFFVAGERSFQIDFLIGANFLKEFRLELDYARGEARLTHLLPSDRVARADQNLFMLNFRPFVHAAINKQGWYLFVLDTGSEITFLNEAELGPAAIRFKPRIHDAMLQGLGGAKKRGASAEDVRIGVDRWAGQFRTLPLYSSERTQALGILGQNFLKNFKVTIDFGSMRLELQREAARFPQSGDTPFPGAFLARSAPVATD
ncbi:MAG TPA: retroviral-like aspartic protease family protein [Thermoanaerobaculia bacterium]|nr:retroviral-like aspartic protease family protein [Thermoanaerobaculia bacterium]